MIKFVTAAKVYSISPVIEIPTRSGQPYLKRELVLDDSWEKDGRIIENLVLVEFSSDKMNLLDGVSPGERLQVEIVVSGRNHNGRVFNTLRGQGIASMAPAQNTSPAPPPFPPADLPFPR